MTRTGSGCDGVTSRPYARLAVGMTLATMCFVAGLGDAGGKQKSCSETARTLFAACKAGVADDTLVKKAVCMNFADAAKQALCRDQARADRDEGRQLCQDQRDTRLATCKRLGEGYHDPEDRSGRIQ